MINTKKALIEYDANRAGREALFDAIESDSDFFEWEALEKSDTEKVCVAYYEDTKSFNTLANCLLLSAEEARRIVNSIDARAEKKA